MDNQTESLMRQKDLECLEILKKKIADEKDERFKNSIKDKDDDYLLRFVRGRKQNADKALKTLKNHVYVKEVQYKDFFEKLQVSKVQHVLNNPCITASLKHRDDKGRLVGVFNCGKWDPDKIHADDILLNWVLQAEALWTDEGIQRNGIVLIQNNPGFGLKQLKMVCSPRRLNMFFNVFMDCYPLRIKEIHYVDNPVLYDVVLKMSKSLMTAKMRSRLMSHHSNDLSTFHEHVPARILPNFLGGDLKPEEALDFELNRKLLAQENIEFNPAPSPFD